jgi:hypothetical protein
VRNKSYLDGEKEGGEFLKRVVNRIVNRKGSNDSESIYR